MHAKCYDTKTFILSPPFCFYSFSIRDQHKLTNLVPGGVDVVDLGHVILVQTSLESHPRLGFQLHHIFHHFQDVTHLSHRHHLLLPLADRESPETLDRLKRALWVRNMED